MIESLGLFSRNESIDEVTTVSLPFMAVQHLLGMASQKIRTEDKEDRRFLLMGSKSCLEEFMGLLECYEVYRAPKQPSDPMTMRTAKIERMRHCAALERSIAERKVAIASTRTETVEGDSPLGVDEETLRAFHLDQLILCALRTEQELSLIEAELSLLAQAAADSPGPPVSNPGPSNVRKVMQPFTLYSSKRDQVRARVFRPDYNLPTMTIDEYLDLERQRGGILEGGGPASARQESEDEDALQDDEESRQKVIRTDAYRDDHRRGSGNTYNRG
jgi:hypothetical protein